MRFRERRLSRDASPQAQMVTRMNHLIPPTRVNSHSINKLKSQSTETCMVILWRALPEPRRLPSRAMALDGPNSNRNRSRKHSNPSSSTNINHSSSTNPRHNNPSLRLVRHPCPISLNPSSNSSNSHHLRVSLSINIFKVTPLLSNRCSLHTNNIITALPHRAGIKHSKPRH